MGQDVEGVDEPVENPIRIGIARLETDRLFPATKLELKGKESIEKAVEDRVSRAIAAQERCSTDDRDLAWR